MVVVEEHLNDALKVFAWHYQAPLVVFCSAGTGPWNTNLVGSAKNTYYYSTLTDLTFLPDLGFLQRLSTSFLHLLGLLSRRYLYLPEQNEIMRKYFPEAPGLEEIKDNVSLYILNSHVSTSQPVPLLRNMIEIGGYHVGPPVELSPDLQNYLDEAEEGVVYFSMGSILKGGHMPSEKRDAILRVLSKIEHSVLWKWEEDGLPGRPSNVKLSKWVPQESILGEWLVLLYI